MAQKYLITAQDVKDHTDAQQNTDNQFFEPRLARCQEKYIRPVLGNALYEQLCDALEAEPETPMSEPLDKLHTQIMPVMAQWVFFKSLPFLTVKATNKGLATSQETPSDAEQRLYAKEAREEAEDRTNDLKAWLEKNKADYPNYNATPKASRPLGGIVF
ncbi:DUF6712 family protein [Rufibacter soli]